MGTPRPLHEDTEKLALTKTTSAVTYEFRAKTFGWASCTINESTGDLAITSDWGNFAFQWNPRHIGSPSLHAFIGRGSLDYLANKLIPGSCYVFDEEATTSEFRRLIIEARREGRLERDQARDFWDELGSLAADCSGDSNLYLERFLKSDFCCHFEIERPWEYQCERPSNAYRALVEIVLPPLCAVCAAEAPKHARPEPAEVAA
jgi:ribonucleotide reductase alpha subunit